MVRVDLLDSVRGLKTLLGGYFRYFNLISCLNVSHKSVEHRLLIRTGTHALMQKATPPLGRVDS